MYWDNSFEIVHALMDAHPDLDVSSVGLAALYQMVIGLPDFADDPSLVNDGILKDILREWYEESDQDGI